MLSWYGLVGPCTVGLCTRDGLETLQIKLSSVACPRRETQAQMSQWGDGDSTNKHGTSLAIFSTIDTEVSNKESKKRGYWPRQVTSYPFIFDH